VPDLERVVGADGDEHAERRLDERARVILRGLESSGRRISSGISFEMSRKPTVGHVVPTRLRSKSLADMAASDRRFVSPDHLRRLGFDFDSSGNSSPN